MGSLTDAVRDSNGTTIQFDGVAVDEITFHGQARGGTVTVRELPSLPADASDSAPGTGLIHAVDIDVPGGLTQVSATIRFTLATSALDGADPATVRIAHRDGSGWSVLDTRVVRTDDASTTFAAETDGFSVFAAVVVDETPASPATVTRTATPPASETTALATSSVPTDRSTSAGEPIRQVDTTPRVSQAPSIPLFEHPELGLVFGVVLLIGAAAFQRWLS